MIPGPPRRWLIPVVVAVLVGAAVVSISEAQPQPAPSALPSPPPVGQPPGAPATIDDVLGLEVPPPAEEAPPVAAAPGPAQSQTVVEVQKEKEKPAESTPLPQKAPAAPARVRRAEAVIQTLDKVTAESIRFSAVVGKPVRWKDLVFTVHACEEPGPDDSEVQSEPRVGPGRTPPPAKMVYRGWMFAEAPAVHPFEHPVYDAWLIACRTA
jgi:hypothetical protein